MKNMLDGYKTYLAAIAALLVAVGALINQYVNNEPMNFELTVSAFIALAMIFLRQGIARKTEK